MVISLLITLSILFIIDRTANKVGVPVNN